MNGEYERTMRMLDYIVKAVIALMTVLRWYRKREASKRIPDDEI